MKEHAALFKKLGKHKAGVGCLYINKLDDVDLNVLETVDCSCNEREVISFKHKSTKTTD